MNFDSLDSLNKYMKDKIRDSMKKEVSDGVVGIVKDQINKDVYSHQPAVYKRTRELRESVEGKEEETEKGSMLKVEHDTSKITPQGYNQHRSVVDGTPSNEALPEIVNDGRSGRIFGRGFWTAKRPYIRNARVKIESENKHVEALKKGLKRNGLEVTD